MTSLCFFANLKYQVVQQKELRSESKAANMQGMHGYGEESLFGLFHITQKTCMDPLIEARSMQLS